MKFWNILFFKSFLVSSTSKSLLNPSSSGEGLEYSRRSSITSQIFNILLTKWDGFSPSLLGKGLGRGFLSFCNLQFCRWFLFFISLFYFLCKFLSESNKSISGD